MASVSPPRPSSTPEPNDPATEASAQRGVGPADRLEDAFLGALSHEFRTPLNVILGYLDLLAEAETSDERRDLRQLIRRHAGAMLSMLDNALYVADLRLGRVVTEAQPFDLVRVVEIVAGEARTLWGRPDVVLELNLEPNLPQVRSDRRLVTQILKNLLSDALCFTEQGEVVSIQVRRKPGHEVVVVSVTDGAGRLSIFDRELLLEEYSALRAAESRPGQAGRGLGLALPVAKRLTELVGGKLEIDPAKGGGSRFWFELPAAPGIPTRDAEQARAAGDGAAAPARRGGPRRVRRECPPFPAVLGVITSALNDPTADLRDVAQALRSDEALSLTLLHYTNSPFMARRRAVSTVEEALGVVGLAGVRSVVLTKFVYSLFTRWSRVEEFLWEHSLAGAIAASLQGSPGYTLDDVYLCGLLHNLGKAVINSDDPESYADVVLSVAGGSLDFSEAELSILGVQHTEVGAEVLAQAAVPAVVRQVARTHHDVAGSGNPQIDALCGVLRVADAIAYRSSGSWAAIWGRRDEPQWLLDRLAAHDVLPAEVAVAREAAVRSEVARLRAAMRI